MSSSKRCRVCGEEKPVGEFYRASHGPLRTDCKSCTNAYTKAWQREHPEKMREYERRAYQKRKAAEARP